MIAKDAAELRRIHTTGYRQDGRKLTVAVRQEAIGIRYNPLAVRVAPGGGVCRCDRDINPVGIGSKLAGDMPQIESVPAAGIQDYIFASWRYNLTN